jgi:putative mRNA 3-end processing factor
MERVVAAPSGLFCPPGGFHLDPVERVSTGIVTRLAWAAPPFAAERTICAEPLAELLRSRLPSGTAIEAVPYGQRIVLGETVVSLHASGHHLGASQVRIESGSEVWLVATDFTRDVDPSATPFEPLECDVLVTDARYALPIYRWEPRTQVLSAIQTWWDACREAGRAALLFCNPVGKAQRILAGVAAGDHPVLVHPEIEAATTCCRSAVPYLAPTELVPERGRRSFAGELVLAPSWADTAWLRRVRPVETAVASGAMRVRGTRRRGGSARGFCLSDQADWPALLRTAAETGARRVLARGRHAEELARYLRESGTPAEALA